MHNALAIANYFVQSARDAGIASKDFTALKVHGLVYLAHGWMLGTAGAPIVDRPVYACRDGVLLPELRDAGCWGTKNVTDLVSVVKMDDARGIMVEQTPMLNPRDATVSALAWVWKTYGAQTSFSVAELVKELGGPWDQVWNDEKRADEEPKPIPDAIVRKWFRGVSSGRKESRHSELARRSGKYPAIEKTQQLLTVDAVLRAR